MSNFDFSGWATRNDIKCSDGRTIRRDAFKHNDGQRVPLVWNHSHNDPLNVLGYALLENRDEGVYAYGKFNDTEAGQNAKLLVQHGDVTQLSIYANQLKQQGGNVLHGSIRELSLVLAGANPGAFIDSVISHGEGQDEEAVIYTGENIELYHADAEEKEDESMAHKEETIADVFNTLTEKQKTVVYAMIGKALEGDMEEDEAFGHSDMGDGETAAEVFDSLTDVQKDVVYAMLGEALEGDVELEEYDEEDEEDYEENEEDEEVEHSEGGNYMKHNVFDQEEMQTGGVLTHSDQMAIINIAKSGSVGRLQDAIAIYSEDNDVLAHGIDEIEQLFPEYKDVKPGAPELITRDLGWVGRVIKGVHKSPISRIRTRQMDARGADLRAKGYKKGNEKSVSGNLKLMGRTTDPQTIYRKDALHRDDIIDITDFDVVSYQYGVMKDNLYEDIALAIMVGDGREDGAADKIEETHVRSIWHDDELYTIHQDVDMAAMKAELQGSNTGANFGENYIYAEAMIQSALYAREQYKGSGSLEMYCTPHLLNVMLLARDLNGRRIYSSKADLAAALNVTAINTVEQFEGLTRTDKDGKTKKLLSLFVNLNDYQVGSTKGGEITKFNQFDIDFNQEKYLIETRISGALTRIKSAIALEEVVA